MERARDSSLQKYPIGGLELFILTRRLAVVVSSFGSTHSMNVTILSKEDIHTYFY